MYIPTFDDVKEKITAFFDLMSFPVVSIEADEKLATITVAAPLPENLHKPWIDEVKIKHPETGTELSRIPDVLDVRIAVSFKWGRRLL